MTNAAVSQENRVRKGQRRVLMIPEMIVSRLAKVGRVAIVGACVLGLMVVRLAIGLRRGNGRGDGVIQGGFG